MSRPVSRAAIVAFALCSLALPTHAGASGITTHAFMAESAIPFVQQPRLRDLLAAHTDEVLAGAHYPDAGYGSSSYPGGDFGEVSHWERFVNAYAAELRGRADCAPIDDPSGPCASQVAHLMGVAAHGMGDEMWDWLFEPQIADYGEIPGPSHLPHRPPRSRRARDVAAGQPHQHARVRAGQHRARRERPPAQDPDVPAADRRPAGDVPQHRQDRHHGGRHLRRSRPHHRGVDRGARRSRRRVPARQAHDAAVGGVVPARRGRRARHRAGDRRLLRQRLAEAHHRSASGPSRRERQPQARRRAGQAGLAAGACRAGADRRRRGRPHHRGPRQLPRRVEHHARHVLSPRR